LVQQAALGSAQGGDILLRTRLQAGELIDRHYGSKAGLVRALLIADSRQIESDIRQRFADAGIVHMLSISGLHVGIIAAAALLLLRSLRVPATAATVASTVATAVYVLVIGAPPSAVRAAAMLFVFGASRLLQRPTSPWAALGVGALAPLLGPDAVLSLGYQLSVSGMAGIICAGILCARLLPAHRSSTSSVVVSSMVATIVASLATAPILAWHFGRISLIAPLTNLAAAPLMLLLQPLLFLSLLLAPLPALSSFAADAAAPLLNLLELIAHYGASPGWGAIDVAPSLYAASVAALATVAALVAAAGARRPYRYLVLSLTLVSLLVWWPLIPGGAHSGRLELHLIDVGQGDAIAVRVPDGRWLLFDAGRSWRGGDAGRRQIVPYLRARGGDLQAFVLSHPHSDHVGGAESVIRWLKPRLFWDAAFVAANEDYLLALQRARDSGTEWHRVRPGQAVTYAGVTMEFLAPDSSWTAGLSDPNEASVVVMLKYGEVKFLFTGDAEHAEEEWLVAAYGERLRATVLKVAHHGSKTSSTQPFLDAVRPAVALVSVGVGNRYGHPSPQVMDALFARGALTLRTDLLGNVVLSTDGKRLWARVNGDTWALR
jgi:competence protein ComEC